jgi:AraC-like DNA-binding protein
MKHDASRLPALTAESLRGAPPPGPVRFALHDSPDLLADGRADFSLLINLGRPCLISQGVHELWLEESGATLVSTAGPHSFTYDPRGDVLALRFPRAALGALANRIEDLCLRPIPPETPALSLLRDYVGFGREDETVADGSLQQLFVTHVHDLIALAVGASRDGAAEPRHDGLRAARLHAIKQDIDRRLGEPDLSAAALAQRHGCTSRFIQRLFEQEGTTFTGYVLVRRLARAHGLLSDPRRRAEKISEVALDCGFGDVSYFNRAFRHHYGASPSDVRALAPHDVVTRGRRDN